MTSVEAWRRSLTEGLSVLLACLMGFAAAAAITGAFPLPHILTLPPPLIASGIVLLALAPLLIRRWRVTFWLLLSWLIVEDLIRKLLGNDLAVYFAKDLIYLMLVIGLAMDRNVRDSWRQAAGSARFALYALVSWALAMSIVSAFEDWRLPLVGLRLDFLFVLLVPVGFIIAREPRGLRRLLMGVTAIGVAACLVGIAQGIIGPSFLSPSIATPGLRLELIRTHDVFQPTGTFADAGRFGALAQITLVTALALVLVSEPRDRWIRCGGAAAVVVAAAAVWVQAGKANLVVSLALLALAFAAPSLAERRASLVRGATAAGTVLITALLLSWMFPKITHQRVDYFRETLDPRVSTNEWSMRSESWLDNTIKGGQLGGIIGQGTGVATLGRQYIYGRTRPSSRRRRSQQRQASLL